MKENHIPEPTLRLLLKVALPMIISQASETIMMFADRLFLAQLGKNYISAAMSGGLTAFTFSSLFIGVISYVNALVGQFYGANKKTQCLQSTTQSIYLAIMVFPIILLLIPVVKYIFILAGHTQNQINLEYTYFAFLMIGALPLLIRNALAGFFLGIGETKMVMIANGIGMCINIPLNYLLIYGYGPVPAMGLRGAAIGTIGGSFAIAIILFFAYIRHKLYRTNHELKIWKLNSVLMKRLLRYGLPSGGEMFFNTFAFNIFLQLMHSMSEDVAAAVTITFNYDMLAFIPMIGLGVAVTAVTAQQKGANNIAGVKRATYLALQTGFCYAFIMMILFIFGAGHLVQLFTGGLGSQDDYLTTLAIWMLRLASIYTLADATQLVFAGALRGTGDTKWAMYISTALHWVMASGTFILIKILKVSPLIVWIYFIGFLVILGISMMVRFFSGKWQYINLISEPGISFHLESDHLHIQDY
ncbi:MAG: MATE family efflux transporter [Spirochaetes bacterium]|jgi:MATE family multidrug resistance protein|nr:MATE family efflux transporter [Spirochaetota bacterium]